MPLLSIIIPTYKRPDSSIRLLEQLLSVNDSRIEVICHSNEFNDKLDGFVREKKVKYGFFEENRGPARNILQLLNMVTSDFVLMISDEDYFLIEELYFFLDFLEILDNSISVITCSIFSEFENKFYWSLSESKNITFNLIHNLCLDLIPSYMSGLCWRTSSLVEVDITKFLFHSDYNVYPHLDISNRILMQSQAINYYRKMIIKGNEVKFGGDGYSHVFEKSNNVKLNSFVYGATARAGQYFYRKEMLREIKQSNNFKINYKDYFISNVTLLFTFYHCLMASNTVSYNENKSYYRSIKCAKIKARNLGFYKGDFFTCLFIIVFFFQCKIVRRLVTVMERLHHYSLKRMCNSIQILTP